MYDAGCDVGAEVSELSSVAGEAAEVVADACDSGVASGYRAVFPCSSSGSGGSGSGVSSGGSVSEGSKVASADLGD